jgi:hypothetical protein
MNQHQHHRLTDTVCPLHSGMEEFKKNTEQSIIEQWKAIEGIRRAAWTMAVSMIGTLVVLVTTIVLKEIGIL